MDYDGLHLRRPKITLYLSTIPTYLINPAASKPLLIIMGKISFELAGSVPHN